MSARLLKFLSIPIYSKSTTALANKIKMNWLPLSSEKQLSEINDLSSQAGIDGVVLFKHSTRCSISSIAKNRLERSWKFDSQKLPVYYLDLLSYREISNKIADHFKIEHQSPQLLIIKDGKCIYSASHSEIETASIEGFISK